MSSSLVPPLGLSASAHAQTAAEMQLHGRALVVARIAWVAVALLTSIFVIGSLPAEYARYRVPCVGSECPFLSLTPDDVRDLAGLGVSVDYFAAYLLLCKLAFTVVSFVVGIVLFRRRPYDRLALLLGMALVTLGGTAFSGPLESFLLSFPLLWRDVATFLSFVGNTAIVVCFYLFPDGRFVPGWIRVVAVVFVLLQVNTYFLNSPLLAWLEQYNLFLLLAVFGSMIGAQVYRYIRVSDAAQRQKTKWVVLGLVGTILGTQFVELVLPQIALPHLALVAIGNTIYALALLLIPLSIGLAILRFGLWDIELIINRTLVYGVLTVTLIGIYVLVVGSLGALLRIGDNLLVSLVGAGLVAVLFQPLRERVQRGINRLMYGERDEPYAVLSRLGGRLEATLAPEAVLPTIVETVAQALKLPYVSITLKGENGTYTPAASYGTLRTGKESELMRLPLLYQGEQIGELVLAPRAPGDPFTAADKRLLHDLAHQIGAAAQGVRLTADLRRLADDLQRAREHLVAAREEERRRLRRDLHDGLGPQLASQTLTLTAARKLLKRDPDAADALLADASRHTQEAITDIRRLVYALRPPALDDLGLVAALQEQIEQYRASGVAFTMHAPEQLSQLPAAIEVACYRIAQEAMTNVVRHAHARKCDIRLAVDQALSLDITDDGVGLPSAHRSGVGLNSMRERATEVGGTCTVEAVPGGGTSVRVRLPYERMKDET